MLEPAVIEALDGTDLVALAQCHALDASVFPHASLPSVAGTPGRMFVLVARARAGGPVVGFAGGRRVGSRFEVLGLAVAADRRGEGIGRALLRAATDQAAQRGGTHVVLHVSVANRAALALYGAEGFHVRRRLRRFYRPGLFDATGDAFEMARVLR